MLHSFERITTASWPRPGPRAVAGPSSWACNAERAGIAAHQTTDFPRRWLVSQAGKASHRSPPHEETHFGDLEQGIQPPDKGILSRTLYNDERLKAGAFGLAQGEELSEHTASRPAVLHFLQGKATVSLGDDRHEAKPGTWVHMPAGLRHSIQAKTPVVMLLLLLK